MIFNAGDRVRYVGSMTKNLLGKEGVVIEVLEPTNVHVKWPKYELGVMPSSIELIYDSNEFESDL